MASVTGDFGALARLREQLQDAQSPEFRQEMATVLGVAALKQAMDGFREQRDPYGHPWKALKRIRTRDARAYLRRLRTGKKFRGFGQILVDTGRLRAAFNPQSGLNLQPTPAGFTIDIPVEYASYHQDGTKNMPRRPMLPTPEDGGLGPIWQPALLREAEALMRRRFGKGGR